MRKLSHVDTEGKVRMVDVGSKPMQRRRAIATGYIHVSAETLDRVRADNMKKGEVLTTAEIAGIQAAKRTWDLIPLCHPLPIDTIRVRAEIEGQGIRVTGEVGCVGRTGVEMEALTAVSVALLAVYDMCKAVDKQMTIGQIRLLEKTKEPPAAKDGETAP